MPDKDPKNKTFKDKNQPTEKPAASFGSKVGKFLVLVVVFLVTASMVAYSLKIGSFPWEWKSSDWQGYLTFSQEKAKAAGDEIKAVDWSKFGEKTKQLWHEAPEVAKRIEERLGGARSSTSTPPKEGAKPGETAPATVPAGEVSPSHKLALETMREGITHYRKSPDDPTELKSAKKCFEDAAGHFEKALKETNDDKTKGEIKKDLEACNKYLEDCRAREKT